jgi:hypothetical protein
MDRRSLERIFSHHDGQGEVQLNEVQRPCVISFESTDSNIPGHGNLRVAVAHFFVRSGGEVDAR